MARCFSAGRLRKSLRQVGAVLALCAAGFRIMRVLFICSRAGFHLFFKLGLRNVFACKSSGDFR